MTVHPVPLNPRSSGMVASCGSTWETPEMNYRNAIPMMMMASLLAACSQLVTPPTPSTGGASTAMTDPMVGGAAMYPRQNIIENAVNSKDHTTLVAAVKAAGLVDTLSGPGPFTVFAPTNEAFTLLPDGTVPTLLKPENKATLTKVLTYHVVAGTMDSRALMAAIVAGGGRATLMTVAGVPLVATLGSPGTVMLTDVKGDVATVTIADVYQSNGVIHVIYHVLLPG